MQNNDDLFGDLTSAQPRRPAVRPPAANDDLFGDLTAPRDTLNTYIRNTTAPERPSLLSRVASAASALGRQVADDPIGTLKGVGKGLAQNTMDLGQMAFQPGMAASRIVAEEGGDPMRSAVRAGGALSMLLGPGMRAAGAPVGAALAADYAASAGLGAAQTPNDPAVGAILGLGMNAVTDAPRATRFLRSDMVPDLSDATRGLAQEITPRFPMRRATGTVEQGVPLNKVMPMAVVDRLANPPQMRTQFDAPPSPARPATTERFPEGYSAEPTPPPVAPGALERVFGNVQREFDPRTANDAFDVPNPRPATTERFPDGYSAEPDPVVQRTANIPDALELTAKESSYVMRDDPVTQLRELFKGLETVDTPRGPVAPRADVLFGDDRAFTMPDLPKPKRSVIPRSMKPVKGAVEDAPTAAAVEPVAPTITAPPRASRITQEPAVAKLTPPAAAAIPEAPPVKLRTLDIDGKALNELSDDELTAALLRLRKLIADSRDISTDGDGNAASVGRWRESREADVADIRAERARRAGLGAQTAASSPAVTPAPVAAPIAAAVDAPVAREAVPEANPVTAPSKDATINWQTWLDKDAPGSQTAEARLRSVIESDPELVQNARGYESMATTNAKAESAMKEMVKELTDDPLAADLPGIRAFVQRHGAAGVPALKKLIAQNEQALQDASRAIANSTDPQEIALAQQVIDGIERQQGDLLRGTVKEQAALGRGLNALKLRAKMSTDPDVWLVQAQRAAGDVPLTDDIRNEVRRLARVAADACGGA